MTELTPKVFNVICDELCTTRDCSSTNINLLHRDFNGIEANVSFGYEKFVNNPVEIPESILDLLQIASYVFCADRMANRGSRDSATNVGWARSFHFTIPVLTLDFWDSDNVKKSLNDALSFMTGDRKYEFSFVKAKTHAVPIEYTQLALFSAAESDMVGAADADVMLFSGGLDSLAGAIERLNENPERKLCLVSHKSNTLSVGTQKRLIDGIDGLKQTFGDRIIKYGFECRNKGMKTKEETQRTRMFLFSAIAFAICDRLQKNELFIYENGITSINIPIQLDTVNARASRTTHPKTIGLLEQFYKMLKPDFKIITPFRLNTKAEIVEKYQKYKAEKFISSSVSCSKTRNKPRGTPHCGTCSQCIDRKFAMCAASLEDEDDRYEIDFITADNNDELRNRLLSLLMFVYRIKNSTPFELWAHSPTDFFDIVSYWKAGNLDDNVSEIYTLLSRFADSVWKAAKQMVGKNFSPEKVINSNSLMRILTSQEYIDVPIGGSLTMQTRNEVFVSYAREDKQYIGELKRFLDVLKRDHGIEYWYDGKTLSGALFDDTIKEHLAKAKIAILLVTQNFLASDYIYNEELPEILSSVKAKQTILLWLPIDYCSWHDTELAQYQCAAHTLPSQPLSIMTIAERNAVYTELTREIKDIYAIPHAMQPSKSSSNIRPDLSKQQSQKAINIESEISYYIKEHNQLNVTEISSHFGLSKEHTRTILRKMVISGVITKIGSNRGSYYIASS